MSALGALKGPEENTEWKIAAKDNVAQDRKKEDTVNNITTHSTKAT